jgi:hypothetical protein
MMSDRRAHRRARPAGDGRPECLGPGRDHRALVRPRVCFYLVNRLLPVYVAHGRTRREFLGSVAVFVAGAGAVLAALLAAGFALEAVLYRIMDLPQRVAPERLFDSPTQYPTIFLNYWAMLVVWTTIGLLLAAGFYRSGGNELLVIAFALAMVAVSGYGIGFNGLPFVGAVVDAADLPLAGSLGLCLAALLPGTAVTWALVRDLPDPQPDRLSRRPQWVRPLRCRPARGSWPPAGPPLRSPGRSWGASGPARPASTSSSARPAASRPARGWS